jgi:hypothetical protein
MVAQVGSAKTWWKAEEHRGMPQGVDARIGEAQTAGKAAGPLDRTGADGAAKPALPHLRP